MSAQMTIFDILYPKRINPILEVAKHSSPMWVTSRQELIELCNTDPDIKTFAQAVRHHYCPYGAAGHWGGDKKPNTMRGWDMRTDAIRTEYYDDEGKYQQRMYSWEDFAREVSDLIWRGEYEREDVLCEN